MRIYLGSDHAGFEMKEALKPHLASLGIDVVDVGTDSPESVDYPDYAEKVARAVSAGEAEYGILVCGSGLGMCIAANKVPGVRAAGITDPELAHMFRQHNDGNVLCLGGRYLALVDAEKIVSEFFATDFEGGRHQRRVDKISALETSS